MTEIEMGLANFRSCDVILPKASPTEWAYWAKNREHLWVTRLAFWAFLSFLAGVLIRVAWRWIP